MLALECPVGAYSPAGTIHPVTGCGSQRVEGPDVDGYCTCADCGLWFTFPAHPDGTTQVGEPDPDPLNLVTSRECHCADRHPWVFGPLFDLNGRPYVTGGDRPQVAYGYVACSGCDVIEWDGSGTLIVLDAGQPIRERTA
jgi:hypothetical protein